MNRMAIRSVTAMFGGLMLLSLAATAGAAQPLVDVDWLKANGGKDGSVVLDIRNARDYEAGHIPGAVNSDYEKGGWRVKNAQGTVGMLPEGEEQKRLIAQIGGLGIGNDSRVILVARGDNAADIGTATRVYWTFKVFGHDNVSILDGGMEAYTADKQADKKTPLNPLETGSNNGKATAKAFQAHLRQDMLVGWQDVDTAMKAGVQLLDARPNLQYIGLQKSGAVQRPGTLPGARNVPGEWLTENGGGKFRDKASLAKLYAVADAKTDGETFTFCNTGHWASVTWFVSSELLGNKKVKMYDGSLADWTRNNDAPLEQKIKLN